jgi:hypothetical protein
MRIDIRHALLALLAAALVSSATSAGGFGNLGGQINRSAFNMTNASSAGMSAKPLKLRAKRPNLSIQAGAIDACDERRGWQVEPLDPQERQRWEIEQPVSLR